jgi:competence protein ComGC
MWRVDWRFLNRTNLHKCTARLDRGGAQADGHAKEVACLAVSGHECLIECPQSRLLMLEIMIVVTLIGVLAAVAIPRFSDAVAKAQARACIANLKTIGMAKAQWMVDAQKPSDATPGDDDLFGKDKPLRDKPTCPSGGTYDLRQANEDGVQRAWKTVIARGGTMRGHLGSSATSSRSADDRGALAGT